MNTKEIMSSQVAEEEVSNWANSIDNPDFVPSQKLISAVCRGRISFDVASTVFTVRLVHPVALENGKTIDELRISEPRSEQVKEASKGKGEIDTTLRLLSSITGQPLGVVDRLVLRDLGLAGEIFNFFV